MQRPTGVTIIAILAFLGAIGAACLGLLMFVGSAFVASFFANMPGMGAMAGGVTAVIGVFCLFFAVLYGVTGYGLLALKNWARIITIVLSVIGLIFGLLGLVAAFAHFGMGILVGQIIRVAIAALVLWYLFQPNVKQAFGQLA
jgi:hypothetical protein